MGATGLLYYHEGDPFWEDASISAMIYSKGGLRCSPHPFDILAIHAMYQVKK